MNGKAQYFASYEALAAVSGQMLSAARAADWSVLPALQVEFLRLVDELKEAARALRSTSPSGAASSN